MSLILSTGTNLGSREKNLAIAKEKLSLQFELLECSQIYSSPAVDYIDQPDFLNQILVFKSPSLIPSAALKKILSIEAKLGRTRTISKGPRNIDIDILFWNKELIDQPELQVPHPRLFERSFIVLPLKELTIFAELNDSFDFPNSFANTAEPHQQTKLIK